MSAKIFLVIASFPDSIVSFRGDLIKDLAGAGFEVHVAAPGLSIDSKISNDLINLGTTLHDIPLQRTGTHPAKDLWTILSLCLLMIRLRPSFVFCYTIKPSIYGTIAAWLCFVPKRIVLITGLGYAFQGNKDRSKIKELVQSLYKFSLSRAHVVFFQNPDDQSLFHERNLLSFSTPSFVLNGSGVDTQRFNLSPIGTGPIRFLLIARLLGDKGVREYVQAARDLRRAHPDVICSIAGWIDTNPDSISQTELDSWINDGVIDFLGRLDDVRPAIANCCVYVLPSYREGTPRTVLEAMSMGRPVITTDAPGCRETVIDGENGFLIPVKSHTALYSAMLQFIENPSLVVFMGNRSRQIAQEKYDVHKVNAAMFKEMGIF